MLSSNFQAENDSILGPELRTLESEERYRYLFTRKEVPLTKLFKEIWCQSDLGLNFGFVTLKQKWLTVFEHHLLICKIRSSVLL